MSSPYIQNLVSHGSSISAASMAAKDATETVLDTSRTTVANVGPMGGGATGDGALRIGEWAIDLVRSGSGRGGSLGVELRGSSLPFGYGVSDGTVSQGPSLGAPAGAAATPSSGEAAGSAGELTARTRVSGNVGLVTLSSSPAGLLDGGTGSLDDPRGEESAPIPTEVGVEVLATVERTIEAWIRSLAGGQVPAGVEVVPGAVAPGGPVAGEARTFGLRGPLIGGASAAAGSRGPDLLVSLVWKGSWSTGASGSGDYWRVDEVPFDLGGPVAAIVPRDEPGPLGPSRSPRDATRAE